LVRIPLGEEIESSVDRCVRTLVLLIRPTEYGDDVGGCVQARDEFLSFGCLLRIGLRTSRDRATLGQRAAATEAVE
jgi:hypothetical protein